MLIDFEKYLWRVAEMNDELMESGAERHVNGIIYFVRKPKEGWFWAFDKMNHLWLTDTNVHGRWFLQPVCGARSRAHTPDRLPYRADRPVCSKCRESIPAEGFPLPDA